jgi:uncharacterized Fe-S cluster-containing radical SAM superfamily enzyme
MCERGAAVAPKTVMSLDMMMMLCSVGTGEFQRTRLLEYVNVVKMTGTDENEIGV